MRVCETRRAYSIYGYSIFYYNEVCFYAKERLNRLYHKGNQVLSRLREYQHCLTHYINNNVSFCCGITKSACWFYLGI